ncbi:MAG TPA: FtsX-like permease family protein [Vicinamibacterales bacterium]|nr:FtsX-like permease family protein [Vicinamibacterales bacterium]
MMFVLAMTVRELRASWKRLLFFFVCLSIGVGSIVSIRSVIQSVRGLFDGEARALITSDLMITSNQPLSEEAHALIDARLRQAEGISHRAVEVATMVRSADPTRVASRMVELRAVERAFPLYGTVKLGGGEAYDYSLLEGFGVLVRPELQAQLGVRVGDRLLIGTQPFTIRGVVEAEPGRRLGAFSLGPRVFISYEDLQSTGLLTYGSRASYQRLVKVPDANFEALLTGLRSDLANTFARFRSYKATEDDIGEDFARAENYLSLVGLVIVILGGIGVSSVTRVFIAQKVKSIAILKCLGGRSRQLLAIYMTQVIMLGLAGSAFGVLLAALAVAAIPSTVAAAAGVTVDYSLTASAIVQGFGIGLLVSILFSLPPLLEIRDVKPSLLLRAEAGPRRFDVVQVAVIVLAVAGLVALTVWQAGSLRIGSVVAIGFAATALVLHVAGMGLIRAIRPLANARWFPLRHAVLQLSRPGSQARIVLLAVGLGSFFIVGVRSLQENLIREFTVNLSPDLPDMFLLDVQQDQVARMTALLKEWQQPGTVEPQLMPILRARVVGVEGREVLLEDYEDVRGRGSLAREYTITYRPRLERNETVIDGTFWDDSPSAEGEVSIEESLRERFRINTGDLVRFDVMGRQIEARVTSIRRVDWADSRAGGFMFVFRPGLLDNAPHGFISFFRGPTDVADRARLQSQLVSGFPNVSVIDGREMLSTIRTIVENVTLAVTVVGSLVVLSGLLILIGAVAMTKFRRIYEAAIFKTLGATRRMIASVLLIEYGVLGALSGTIGSIGAIALTWGISRFALDIPWTPLPLISVAGIVISAVLVAVVGVTASWEVLQRKPLATLRAE